MNDAGHPPFPFAEAHPLGVQPQRRRRHGVTGGRGGSHGLVLAHAFQRLSGGERARRAQPGSCPPLCTRFRISPASGIRSSASRSTKYDASRSASGSGVATTRNDVPGACSSR